MKPDEVFTSLKHEDFVQAEQRIKDFWGNFPALDKLRAIPVESRDVTPIASIDEGNPLADEGILNRSLGDSGSLDA